MRLISKEFDKGGAELEERTLDRLGWGYRSPRVVSAVQTMRRLGGDAWLQGLAHLSVEEARASLMELSGVGRKVADCILLFGYGRADVIPVDTHAFQLAQRIFAPQLRGLTMSPSHYETAVKGFQRSFGTRSCGWAFMALFVAELHPFRRYLEADRPKALAAATSPRRGATLVPATPRPRDARKRAALSDVEPAGRVRRKRTRSAACGQGEG